MIILRYAMVVVLLMGTCSIASGHIALDVSTTCTTTETGVMVSVALVNVGSEAAMDLNIMAECEDTEGALAIPGPLGPGQVGTYQLNLGPDISEPGTYAVITHIKYHNDAGYPFTALDAASFASGRPAPPMIFPQTAPVVLKGSTVFKVELNNTDTENHSVLVWLEVPETLKAPEGPREIEVKAGGGRQVAFRLENRFAGLNSTQPYIVKTAYSSVGQRHTSVIKGYITVERPEKFFRQYGVVFLGAAALTLAMVLIIQVVWGSPRLRPGRHRP